jgi:T5SS/PEP-CTERM-associated repeat protein
MLEGILLTVGREGMGQAFFRSGASTVNSMEVIIGQFAGSNGTLEVTDVNPVSGDSAVVRATSVSVGEFGYGRLLLLRGGELVIDTFGLGAALGGGQAEISVLSVTPKPSRLLGGIFPLRLGSSPVAGSDAQMTVAYGGEASFGMGQIGHDDSVVVAPSGEYMARVSVDSGSLEFLQGGVDPVLDVLYKDYIGVQNEGRIDVLNGGLLTTKTTVIGVSAPCNGESPKVLVDGSGSTWDAGTIYLGVGDKGMIDVDNGGFVQCDNLYLSAQSFLSLFNGSSMIVFDTAFVGAEFIPGPQGVPISPIVGVLDGSTFDAFELVIGGGPGAGSGAFYLFDGTVEADTIRLNHEGLLYGTAGQITGTLIHNGGVLAPGFSPGNLSLQGDYLQPGDGELQLELFKDVNGVFTWDTLEFGGSVSLQGRVRFVLGDEALPEDLTGMNVSDFLGFSPGNTQPPLDLSQADVSGVMGETVFGVEVGGDGSITVTNVSVGPPPAPVLPTRFALLQNAPNPFRSSTSIRFDLPEPGAVRLVVYDVHGRRVRALRDEEFPAGNHEVWWDRRNDSGGQVASGLYFYQIHANDKVATRKMILVD